MLYVGYAILALFCAMGVFSVTVTLLGFVFPKKRYSLAVFGDGLEVSELLSEVRAAEMLAAERLHLSGRVFVWFSDIPPREVQNELKENGILFTMECRM